MKTAQVVYYTKSGNTEKLAKGIGEELACPVGSTDTQITEKIDVLFLGASLYKFGMDKNVTNFINGLDATKVGKVAIFTTSCGMETGYGILKKAVERKGISVCDENFYCRGKFLAMNKNRPNEDDVLAVRSFAKAIIG